MRNDEILSTAEAARLLGVSEASVRRWSDAGLLAVERLGARGERRFKRKEVERLAASPERPAAGAPPARLLAPVQVGGWDADPFSGHLAVFYDSDETRLRRAGPFLEDGLLAGDPCMLLARGAILESYFDWLRASRMIHLDSALRDGRLVVAEVTGRTVVESLRYWESVFWAAAQKRGAVVRVVGDMASQREGFVSEAEMLAQEAALNSLTRRFPSVLLCQYDVRAFSGAALLTALRAHPDLYGVPLRHFLA